MEKNHKSKKKRIIIVTLLIITVIALLLLIRSCSKNGINNLSNSDNKNNLNISNDSLDGSTSTSSKLPGFANEDFIYKTGDSYDPNPSDKQNGNTQDSDSFYVYFLDDDGTLLEKSLFKRGETPSFSGTVRSKTINGNKYIFDGWDKKFKAVYEEQTYIATYKKDKSDNSNPSSSGSSPSHEPDSNPKSDPTPSHDPDPTPSSPTKDPDPSILPSTITLSYKKYPFGGGHVTGIDEVNELYDGTTITLTATPSRNYSFAMWSDGCTDNPRTEVVAGNKEYTPIFVPNAGEQITVDFMDGSSDYFLVFGVDGTKIKLLCTRYNGESYIYSGQEGEPYIYKDSKADQYMCDLYDNMNPELKKVVIPVTVSQEIYTGTTIEDVTYDSSIEVGERYIYTPNLSDYIDFFGGIDKITLGKIDKIFFSFLCVEDTTFLGTMSLNNNKTINGCKRWLYHYSFGGIDDDFSNDSNLFFGNTKSETTGDGGIFAPAMFNLDGLLMDEK